MVGVLLEEPSIDIHKKNGFNRTVLHEACWKGQLDIVRSLVEAGSDVSAVDEDGDTPEQMAKNNGHSNIYDYLSKL